VRVFSILSTLGGGGGGRVRGLLLSVVCLSYRCRFVVGELGHLACLDWWKFNDRIRSSRGRVRAGPSGQK
jgi:hypothetical protein